MGISVRIEKHAFGDHYSVVATFNRFTMKISKLKPIKIVLLEKLVRKVVELAKDSISDPDSMATYNNLGTFNDFKKAKGCYDIIHLYFGQAKQKYESELPKSDYNGREFKPTVEQYLVAPIYQKKVIIKNMLDDPKTDDSSYSAAQVCTLSMAANGLAANGTECRMGKNGELTHGKLEHF